MHAFAAGVRFIGQVERDGLEFKHRMVPTLKPQERYNFVCDRKFRPLLDPPLAGVSKYEQVLTWARKQVALKAQ